MRSWANHADKVTEWATFDDNGPTSATRDTQEVRGPLARSQLLRCRAIIAQAQARFPEAARLDAEAFAAMAATGHFPTLLMHAAFLGLTGHQVGQSRESLAANGITDAHTSAQDFPTQGVVIALSAAWQLAEVGRVREAAAILRSLGPAAGWEPAPHGSMFVFAIGIDLCVRLDAGDDVAALIERLGANRGHHCPVTGKSAHCTAADLRGPDWMAKLWPPVVVGAGPRGWRRGDLRQGIWPDRCRDVAGPKPARAAPSLVQRASRS